MFTCEDEYDHIPNMIILVHGILKLILHSFSCMLLLFQLGIYYSILNIFILFYHYFYYLFGLILIFLHRFSHKFWFPSVWCVIYETLHKISLVGKIKSKYNTNISQIILIYETYQSFYVVYFAKSAKDYILPRKSIKYTIPVINNRP